MADSFCFQSKLIAIILNCERFLKLSLVDLQIDTNLLYSNTDLDRSFIWNQDVGLYGIHLRVQSLRIWLNTEHKQRDSSYRRTYISKVKHIQNVASWTWNTSNSVMKMIVMKRNRTMMSHDRRTILIKWSKTKHQYPVL